MIGVKKWQFLLIFRTIYAHVGGLLLVVGPPKDQRQAGQKSFYIIVMFQFKYQLKMLLLLKG